MKTPAGVSAYVMNDLFTCCLSKADAALYVKLIKQLGRDQYRAKQNETSGVSSAHHMVQQLPYL